MDENSDNSDEFMPPLPPPRGSDRKAKIQPQIPKKFEFRLGHFVPNSEKPKFVKEMHRRGREKSNGTDFKKAEQMKHQLENPHAEPKTRSFSPPPKWVNFHGSNVLVDDEINDEMEIESDIPAVTESQQNLGDYVPKPPPHARGLASSQNPSNPLEELLFLKNSGRPFCNRSRESNVYRASVEPSHLTPSYVPIEPNAPFIGFGGLKNMPLNDEVIVAQRLCGNSFNAKREECIHRHKIPPQPIDRIHPCRSQRSSSNNAPPPVPQHCHGSRQMIADFYDAENRVEPRIQQRYQNSTNLPADRRQVLSHYHASPIQPDDRPIPPPRRSFHKPNDNDYGMLHHHADEHEQAGDY